MSNIAFELFAKLGLDSSEYEQGLEGAKNKATSIGGVISGGLKTVGKASAVMGAAIAGATVAAGTALVKGASDVAVYGDNIDKMSQKMGISAQAYQEWDAIMQHSGTSIEALKPSMKTLANAAENGSDAFQKLGISQEEVASLSQEDLFAKVITGLQGMEEGTERTYLTSQLLGRGATELGALLNTSAEDTEKMRQRVHELGGVMSDEAVKASAAYQDSLQDMQTGFSSLKRNMVSEFLPSITTVMDGLTNIFSGDTSTGLEQISEGIDSAVSSITDVIPKVMEVGVNIVESLATAILDNAPKLFPSLVSLVLNIGTMIVENLPMLIETGLSLILEIATGIAEAIPSLIPTIVEVVLQIVSTLIDNIDLLVEAAIQLTIGLANGLILALPILIEKAPEIVMKLVDALITNAPLLLNAAISLIITLVKSLLGMLPKVYESGKQILQNLVSGIKSLLSNMGAVALELVNKFVASIKSNASKLLNAGKEMFENVKNGIMQRIEDAKNWGRDLIENFIGGIKEKIGGLKDAVSGVAETIASPIHFSVPDEGPLSDADTYMPDMMKLFAQGIRDNEHLVRNQLYKSFDFSNLIEGAEVELPKSRVASKNNDIIRLLEQIATNRNVTVVLEGDADRLFRVIQREDRRNKQITGMESFA